MNRRKFLERTGLVVGLEAACGIAAGAAGGVPIIVDPEDKTASSPPARWAVSELEGALKAHASPAGGQTIVVSGSTGRLAREVLKSAKVAMPSAAEALGLAEGQLGGKPVLLASGSDARGLVYAVLELADRARHGLPLRVSKPIIERPANVIRSIARCFVSDVEDKPWFYDRAMWREYLSMLASQRYNRFSLTLGIGYNSARHIPDAYFYFAYPFLVSVPGYDVRADGLPDAERDRNLQMLRFISDETAARGLHFQLALWSHAYQWPGKPRTNYTIEGLNPANHAPYCRDALAAVLKACPAISGMTFRVHGESGVSDGSYDFWKTLFDGIVRCGRRVEIDMHAKMTNQRHIDIAIATGMPVNMSPKYWAEHMGMPYHQAAIRELEMPRGDPETNRRFLRYGYGDLLKENRKYGVLHRIWPGTQRHLLWGDPVMAAGYGRNSSFCGSVGVELLEPLSFKGRIGSGIPGGRCAYADKSLSPRYDWAKFLYQYRVWGRLIYNPDTDPDGWRRYLRREFQGAAQPVENALASASRILPVITTTRGLSGSNNTYWPEMYTSIPIVDPEREHPYKDTPQPARFGTVTAFDPQLFSRVDDFAEALLDGHLDAKYSPLEVARWLEDLANAASRNLAEAESRIGKKTTPEFRRFAVDIAIQSGLGLFFTWRLRSAVSWALHERTGDMSEATEALDSYRKARKAWAELAERAKGVYASDITYGPSPHLRGHWLDRLAAIDGDMADMEKKWRESSGLSKPAGSPPPRPVLNCSHVQPARFQPEEPLEIVLALNKTEGRRVLLHYRHVNQAERWQSGEMQWRNARYHAVIPADYTNSPYPLQYYFEAGGALYPGFEPNLSNLPYFVVSSRRSAATTSLISS